jgi:signal transduction histidine kinase
LGDLGRLTSGVTGHQLIRTLEKHFASKESTGRSRTAPEILENTRDFVVEPTISDLKARVAALEEALRQSQTRATVGLLALEMIHEIRNPLDAMNGLAFLARNAADEPEKVRMYLDLAGEQMATLRFISSKTLSHSQSAFSIGTANLVSVAEAALRIYQNKIRQRNIRVNIDLPEKLDAPIHFGEMLQVVSNLLANAVDAIPDGGDLRLRIRAQGDDVCIVLADNGCGIPAEHLRAIFEPFFTTKGIHGTGIGLALIKKIIESHRGRIRVRSSVKEHRRGTTFRISIPANA